MRKLPDCPRCGEDELWILRHADYVDLKCYWCGEVATIHPRPAEEELDAAIANAVQRPAGHEGQRGEKEGSE